MEPSSPLPVDKNYVLVVDNSGDTDIFNLSYNVSWEDVSVMLQVKFGHKDPPMFTYTDDEEDFISLDSQESFDEAIKIAKKNNDVLHIQMRKFGVPFTASSHKSHTHLTDTNKPSSSKDHVENLKTIVGNTFEWAKSAVKSTIARRLDSSISEDACKKSVSTTTAESTPEGEGDSNRTSDAEEQPHSQPLLSEVVSSEETAVKEPVESSYTGEISVPTSLVVDEDDDTEMVVKLPIVSSSQPGTSAQEGIGGQDEMLRKIKEEVRMAIATELSAFKDELSSNVVQHLGTDDMTKSTSSVPSEGPRTPRQIKDEIKLLRKEMKEAKQLRKLSKRKDSEESRKARKYAASFICENLLDGSCVAVGQKFVKYWVLKNEGTSVWDHLIELKLVEESPVAEGSPVDPSTPQQADEEAPTPSTEAQRSHLWGPERLSVPMPIVEINGTAVIAVSHTAPSFPCLYTSAWRLSHNGQLFGPSIWCSVEVKSKDEICSERQGTTCTLSSSDFTDQTTDHSYVLGNWETRKPSVHEEQMLDVHDDKLSDMLSFEMAAVGDFNKEAVSSVADPQPVFTFAKPVSILSEGANEPSRPEPVGQVEGLLDAHDVNDSIEKDDFEEIVCGFESVEVDDQKTPTVQIHQKDEAFGNCEQVTGSEDANHKEEAEEVGASQEQENSVENQEEEIDENQEEEIDEDHEEEINEDQEEEIDEDQEDEIDENHEEIDKEVDEYHKEEEVESDVDDSCSVMSDFEVIPLPECFDTTRPLAGSEEATGEGDKSTDVSSTSAAVEESEEQLRKHDEPLPEYEDLLRNGAMDADGSNVPLTEEDAASAELTARDGCTAQPSMQESAETTCVLVPQLASSSVSPFTTQGPFYTPGRAVDLGTTCLVTNTQVDVIPQTTDPVEQPPTQQPIPLPRSAMDAPKAEAMSADERLPYPQPRSVIPCSSTVQCDSLWDGEGAVPNQESQVYSEETNSHQTHDHLEDEEEDAEEFILAPETSDHQSQVLTPPSSHTPPIFVSTSPIEVGANSTPSGGATNPEPYTPSPMEQLVDMGFFDIEMNQDLLNAFQGDMALVVNALLHRDPDEGSREDDSFIA